MSSKPVLINDVDQCVNAVIDRLGKRIVLAAPLGLGKPVQLMNAFYQRAKADPSIDLHIVTALTLERPAPKNEVEAKFASPLIARLFGDYPGLDYMVDLRGDSVPANIRISEFYFKAGAMKGVSHAQRNYISANYTNVHRDVLDLGVNVLVQLVAKRSHLGKDELSFSCNTDVVLDLLPIMEKNRAEGKDFCAIGQVHPELPFMPNDAVCDPARIDYLVENPAYDTCLFAVPNMSVPVTDYVTGMYASSLIADGGTLQIGIGALGDAITYACLLRHQKNALYRSILERLQPSPLMDALGGSDPFDTGLYGSSEMFVNGFLHLIDAGIIKREVYDDLTLQSLSNAGKITAIPSLASLDSLVAAGAIRQCLTKECVVYLKTWGFLRDQLEWQEGRLVIEGRKVGVDLGDAACRRDIAASCLGDKLKKGVILHGGFFLGPRAFYEGLRSLPEELLNKICMTRITRTNALAFDYPLLRAQRQHARFINTGMMVSLSGAVTSDGLEDGTVVSGVGGQYNFVAMAPEIPGARSILCIRAVRGRGNNARSNIVPFYGNVTIPRHLRDIVITEYGIADLRGKSDEQVAIELIQVADSRFQSELLEYAKQHGKLRQDFELEERYRHNTPAGVASILSEAMAAAYFPPYPLGSDLTDEEMAIAQGLRDIKGLMENPKEMIKAVIRAVIHRADPEEARPYLERMDLLHPQSGKELLVQQLLLLELEEHGYLRSI